MSKARKITIGGLLAVLACLAVGVSAWWFAGPFGPARKLVGTWEIVGTEVEDTIKGEIGKADPKIGGRVGDQFRSTERLYLDRFGRLRHVQNLLGMAITSEGTWQVAEANENILSVKVHRRKSSVRDQKGETKEAAEDVHFVWRVEVVEPDRLSVSMALDDGTTKRFVLKRAEE